MASDRWRSLRVVVQGLPVQDEGGLTTSAGGTARRWPLVPRVWRWRRCWQRLVRRVSAKPH